MENWRNVARLPAIKNQTLIVWGDGDQAYQREQVDLLLDGIENANLQIMAGCCHNIHLENPDRFNAKVLLFLRR